MIIALTRHPRFSPRSEAADQAIMMAVADRLRYRGHHVTVACETQLPHLGLEGCEAILTMGRLPATLEHLKTLKGLNIVNAPEAIERCNRGVLTRLMAENGIPMPATSIGCIGSPSAAHRQSPVPVPAWLKRADACAQESGDVVFCRDESSLQEAIGRFAQRGITQYVVSAHEEGDLLKFYGVGRSGTDGQPHFFRYFYPTDDGQTKFGDERHNGIATHRHFDLDWLQYQAERLASIVGLQVYGGDAIVRPDGSCAIIDFNDWPSFARCRDDAAQAIVELIA